jgi:hypothetical protein
MCAEEIAAIQERYPDYPHEYWVGWLGGGRIREASSIDVVDSG